jgi:hypothetical protein
MMEEEGIKATIISSTLQGGDEPVRPLSAEGAPAGDRGRVPPDVPGRCREVPRPERGGTSARFGEAGIPAEQRWRSHDRPDATFDTVLAELISRQRRPARAWKRHADIAAGST